MTTEYLSYLMTRMSLKDGQPNAVLARSYLNKMAEAFADAYSADDAPGMKLVAGFLEDLDRDREYQEVLGGQECLGTIQKLLYAVDLGEGFNVQSSELLFRFVRQLSECYMIDPVALFDTIHKTAVCRLEVKPYSCMSQV